MPGTLVGVDGCPAGWIAIACNGENFARPSIALFSDFQQLLSAMPEDSVVAVDMPIGLPDFVQAGGRGPEQAVRPLLGARQSSVFSIPSRAAVYAEDYLEACRQSLLTSSPPRKVSKQAFNLFPKIRELDQLMTPELCERVFEVHPELAFRQLAAQTPMALPKKIKGRVNPQGMEERRRVLESHGLEAGFLRQPAPRGAASDDFLDACACLVIARRLALGKARPFPDPPLKTTAGIRIAIWA
ncbi:MAG: DUF429 domain-containing protein [Rhizobiaceae bacterium]